MYTARYAGDDKDFNKNMDKVLYELGVLEGEARMAEALGIKVKKVSRRARFKSVITLLKRALLDPFFTLIPSDSAILASPSRTPSS